MNKHGNLIQNI